MLNIIIDKQIYQDKLTDVFVCPVCCDGYTEYPSYTALSNLIVEVQSLNFEYELLQNIYLKTQDEIKVDIMLVPVLKSIEDSCSLATLETAFQDMLDIAKEIDRKTFTMPALGSEIGGLDFETQVKPLMEKFFGENEDIVVDVYL